jgi:hypothetical protein
MPKVEKQRNALLNYMARTTPQKNPAKAAVPADSCSPTPPPSPGAEKRAQEEWRERQAALMARIDAAHAEVQAALQQLQQLKAADATEDTDDDISRNLLAYDELREYGVENVFNTVEQPGEFLDSSSEEGDTESESEKSTEY